MNIQVKCGVNAQVYVNTQDITVILPDINKSVTVSISTATVCIAELTDHDGG